MSLLKSVWGVLVDLVVGDDPKIAVAVLLALGATAGLLLGGVGEVIVAVAGAVLVAAAFTVSLLIDTRRSFGRSGD